MMILFSLFSMCVALRPRQGLEHVDRLFAASERSPPKPQWHTSLVDHFVPTDGRTWQQRYFVNDEYFVTPGASPLFIMLGGEGEISGGFTRRGHMAEMAQRLPHGALLVSIEHRFYGQSRPFNTSSTENLRFLSAEQALADAALFVQGLREQYNFGKVVSFGGSYPGALSAWFRIKYPFLVDMAVATSAPVRAEVDMFQYLEQVGRSVSEIAGRDCDVAIRKAMNLVDELLESASGAATLSKTFNTCEPLSSLDSGNWQQTAMFKQALSGIFMGTVQYNRELEGRWNVTAMCSILTLADPLGSFAALSARFYDGNCVDINYDKMIAEYKQGQDFSSGGAREWFAQTCMEFGYYQTSDSRGQPFGKYQPLKFDLQMCQDIFGWDMARLHLPDVAGTNGNFGSDHPVGATKIIFVNCLWDEWSTLSVTKSLSPELPAVVVREGAHCCTMLPFNADLMPKDILAGQTQIESILRGWLAE